MTATCLIDFLEMEKITSLVRDALNFEISSHGPPPDNRHPQRKHRYILSSSQALAMTGNKHATEMCKQSGQIIIVPIRNLML